MKPISLAIALIGVVILPYGCNAQVFDDPFSQYLERSVTIALGAGNAKDANAAIHAIDPWPHYVGNTRIPGDGHRAVNSIERMYRVPDPFERQGAGGESPNGGQSTGSGSDIGTPNMGASPATPMQPVSGGY